MKHLQKCPSHRTVTVTEADVITPEKSGNHISEGGTWCPAEHIEPPRRAAAGSTEQALDHRDGLRRGSGDRSAKLADDLTCDACDHAIADFSPSKRRATASEKS